MPAFVCSVEANVGPPRNFPRIRCNDVSESLHDNSWSPSLSSSLYNVDAWGAPYFSVNNLGNVAVSPHGACTLPHQDIDLLKVVKKVTAPKSLGGLELPLPLIIRFPDVLKNRLESLQSAFDCSIASIGYGSHYQGVYPVKCNQDKYVVDDVVRFGHSFRFGLEAGSKPELLLAMSSLCNGNPEAFLVCNGYKDEEYISLALFARKMGLNSFIVLEQEEELDLVISLSKKLCIRPAVGFRAKLRTKHSGHFGSTSGEKGKFGLTTAQILRVVKRLKEEKMMDCLKLLHFHIGSQIPSTALLSYGVSEAAQIYCELIRMGAAMEVIDIGGGLGVDYDGTKSGNSDFSVAYSLEEYAESVVRTLKYVCDARGAKHPVICSESGRALVSHQSVLIFEALSSSSSCGGHVGVPYVVESLSGEAGMEYARLVEAAAGGEEEATRVHAERLKEKCVELFKEGTIGMEQLAGADAVCELILGSVEPVRTYHVNLSVFTSIPDFWGVSQLFPILPIHRLEERPAVRGILSDLTCDSDGKVDRFISGESWLPLHEIKGDSKYYLGMFLGGAYQEAIGGLHNLFGGPSVARVVQSDGPHGFAVTQAIPGLSCSDVLRVMQHEPSMMLDTLKRRVDESPVEGDLLFNAIITSFRNCPYLVSSCGAHYDLFASDVLHDPPDSDDDYWSTCCA